MADFTDYEERTEYFGSFFKWTEQGRNQLITRFQDYYPDQANVPAVFYDPSIDLFCIKTNEPLAVKLFAQVLNGEIDSNQRNEDHISGNLLIPLEYTTLPKESEVNDNDDELQNTLIDVEDDSDESTEDSSTGGGPCAFWSPKCGDVSILSTDIATRIATLTDCFLCPESDSRRWRIMQGSTEKVSEKLQNLEPLLEALAKHRLGAASGVNHNLISFTSQNPGTGTTYLSVSQPPCRDRTMVHSGLEEHLDRMLVGEERIWDHQKCGKYSIPDNLLSVQMAQDNRTNPTRVWANFENPAVGKAENAIPRTPSGSASLSSADKGRKASSVMIDQPNKFLPLQEQARLREWSKNIDRGADPAVAAEEPLEAEPVAEPTNVSKRRVEDSDSDSEPPRKAVDPEKTTQRLVAFDSDDEDDLVAAPKMKKQTAITAQTKPRQPIGMQNVDFGHINRAERKPVSQQMLHTRTRADPQKTVSADTFFSGVPRDFGDNDPNAVLEAKGEPPQEKVTASPIAARTLRYSNNYLGLDGSVDITPQGRHQEHEQLLATNSRHNDFAEPSDKNKSAPFEHTSPAYVPSGNFDPSAYGASNRSRVRRQQKQDSYSHDHGQRQTNQQEERTAHSSTETRPSLTPMGPSRTYPRQQNRGDNRTMNAHLVPTAPHPVRNTAYAPNLGAVTSRRRSQRDQLIDYEDEEMFQKEAIAPPPGLTPHSQSLDFGPEPLHTLDMASDDICIQPIQPSVDRPLSSGGDMSFSASSSSGGLRHSIYDYVPQTKVVKPDVSHMRNGLMQQLMAVKSGDARNSRNAETTNHHTERIEEDDEPSTRKFHQTMNLRGPNPGRGKKQVQTQETEAQRKARIAKVMEDLNAEAMAGKSKKEQPKSETTHQSDKLTPRAKRLAKNNPIMAEMHVDELKAEARKQCSKELVQFMRPILEAARAFSGRMELEFQIGQLLVMPTSRLSSDKVYEREKWCNLFEKGSATLDVRFTNILTNNGSDIDGILETKTKKWKTWSRDMVGTGNLTIEFLCQDNLDQSFKLVMASDGSYRTTRNTSIVGKVGIHCPGTVWDICTVLSGSASWSDSSVAFEEDLKEFVSTIYIKPDLVTTVYFRPPASNCLSVQDVVLRRVSHHPCQVPGEEALQLKITEVKTLKTRTHRTDARLHVSHEMKHDAMAGEARAYYEVAITHVDVNHAFDDNVELEAGELSSTLGADMLTTAQAGLAVNAALRLVEKIDWVGSRNYGTLVQKQDEKIIREQQMARTLPPSAQNPTLLRPVQLPSGYSITDPRTVIGGATTIGTNLQTAPTAQPIHGIRAGTYAQIYQDTNGNLFRIGQGGARIPVTLDDGHMNRAEIMPDDSASQIGGRPRTLRSTNVSGAFPKKPENFW